MVCIRTRVAGWLVLSLYPGNQALKDTRRQDILQAMERVTSATKHLSSDIENEISQMSSWLNKESTLQERRNSLRQKRDGILLSAETSAKDGQLLIRRGEALVLEYLKPSRFYLDIQDGQIIGARQMMQRSTSA
jgi:chlorite dismutase